MYPSCLNSTDIVLLQQRLCTVSHDNYWLLPYNSDYAVFMMIMSACTSVGGYLQAWSILFAPTLEERKSTAIHTTLWPWTMAAVANVFWVVYGMMLADFAVVVSSSISTTGDIAVIVLVLHYRYVVPNTVLKPTSLSSAKVMNIKEHLTNNVLTPKDLHDIHNIVQARRVEMGIDDLPFKQWLLLETSGYCTSRRMIVLMFIIAALALYFAISCTVISKCR